MVVNLALLVLGLYMLVKGADVLVEGAVAVAERFGVSKLFIGVSLVAFGTSAPELAVSLTASFKGVGGIAISNVVGSNIANVALCLGVTALMGSVKVKRRTARIEIPFLLIVSASFGAMLLRSDPPEVLWNDGVVLLGFFIIYVFYLYNMAKEDMEILEKVEDINVKKAVVFIVLGMLGVAFGGDFTINSIVGIAKSLGLSNSLFALTVVAVGTSLPELVTSVSAARKGHTDMSVGNIVGSNIMNILVIIGVSSIVGKDLRVDVGGYWVDLTFLLGTSLVLLIFSTTKSRLDRWEGALLVGTYVPYVIYVINRG